MDLAKLRLLYSSKGISKLNSEFKSIRGSAEKNFGAISKTVGNSMLAAGAATAVATGFALKSAMTFETGMREIGNLGVENMAAMREGVLDYSEAMGVDAVEATRDVYDALSAGVKEADTLEVLELSAIAAAVGLGTTADALDLATTMLNGYGRANTKGVTEIDKFKNILGFATKAIEKGKTNMGELGSIMGKIAPLANTAGISMEELFASIATSTAMGIKGSEAVSGLKAAITSIIKPSKEAKEVAKALGFDFSATGLKTMKLGGFVEKLTEKIKEQGPALVAQRDKMKGQIEALEATAGGSKELKKELKGLKDSYKGLEGVSEDQLTMMSAMIGSVEGLNIILAQASTEGSAMFKEALGEMANSQEDMNAAWEKFKEDNPELAFKQMMATVRRLAIEIGDILLPAMKSAIDWVKPLVQLFGKFAKTGVGGVIVKISVALGVLLVPLGLVARYLVPIVSMAKMLGALKLGATFVSMVSGAIAAGGGLAATGAGAMTAAGGFGAMMLAAAPLTIATVAVTTLVGTLAYQYGRLKQEQEAAAESEKKAYKSQDEYIQKMREKGVVLSNEAMKEMDFNERAAYISEQSAARRIASTQAETQADLDASLTKEQALVAEYAREQLNWDAERARHAARQGMTAQEVFDMIGKSEAEQEAIVATGAAKQANVEAELAGQSAVMGGVWERMGAAIQEKLTEDEFFAGKMQKFVDEEDRERKIAILKKQLLEQGLDAGVWTMRKLQDLQAEKRTAERDHYQEQKELIVANMNDEERAAYDKFQLGKEQADREEEQWARTREGYVDEMDLMTSSTKHHSNELKLKGTAVQTAAQSEAQFRAAHYRKGTTAVAASEKTLTQELGAEKDKQNEKITDASSDTAKTEEQIRRDLSDLKKDLIESDTQAELDHFEQSLAATKSGLGDSAAEYTSYFADLTAQANAFREKMKHATNPSQTGSPSLIQEIDAGFAKLMPRWKEKWERVAEPVLAYRDMMTRSMGVLAPVASGAQASAALVDSSGPARAAVHERQSGGMSFERAQLPEQSTGESVVVNIAHQEIKRDVDVAKVNSGIGRGIRREKLKRGK